MSDKNENGIVYHIDMQLLKKAREKALQKDIEKVNEQIKNAEQDMASIKIAETALGNIQAVLLQMREIAMEVARNPTANRKALNRRFDMLKKQIDDLVAAATFNGTNLLDGSMDSINSIISVVKESLE